MNISPMRHLLAKGSPRPGRAAFAMWLLAGLAVATLAGSALAAGGNLVKNGSFEKDGNGDGIPNKWGDLGTTGLDKRVCNASAVGKCSFRMVGESVNKFLVQELAISGDASDDFDLSAWTRGKDLDLTGNAQVIVFFNHTGGGVNQWSIGIPDGTSAWTFRLFIGASSTADFDSISVAIYNSKVSGKMWVDKVKLVPSP